MAIYCIPLWWIVLEMDFSFHIDNWSKPIKLFLLCTYHMINFPSDMVPYVYYEIQCWWYVGMLRII